MNRFYVLAGLMFILFSVSIKAQEFEKKFGDNDRVDMVIVTPDMFSLINEVNENPERAAFYKNLTYFGTFGTNDPRTADQLERFSRSLIQQKHMQLLVKIKQPGKIADLYYVPSDKRGFARELILMVRYFEGNKVRIWHIKGLINLRKISLLALQTTKMDTEVLREAEKKAP